MKNNILITGVTGFLGRHLVKYIIDNKLNYNIVGLANSEKKIALFTHRADVKIYKLNLTSDNFYNDFNNILQSQSVNYVIHNAAMKFVDICEDNPIETLKINTIASEQIVNLCKINRIKNLICLSTDKSNTPFNVYGMSKNIMERIVLKQGYSIYQGANFFGSDGSVLDIWFNQMCSKKPLTVTDVSLTRYFINIHSVCESLMTNIDKIGIILPSEVYKINIGTLLEAFCHKFNYNNKIYTGKKYFEKEIEELDPSITKIIELDFDKTLILLNSFFDNIQINVIKL